MMVASVGPYNTLTSALLQTSCISASNSGATASPPTSTSRNCRPVVVSRATFTKRRINPGTACNTVASCNTLVVTVASNAPCVETSRQRPPASGAQNNSSNEMSKENEAIDGRQSASVSLRTSCADCNVCSS